MLYTPTVSHFVESTRTAPKSWSDATMIGMPALPMRGIGICWQFVPRRIVSLRVSVSDDVKQAIITIESPGFKDMGGAGTVPVILNAGLFLFSDVFKIVKLPPPTVSVFFKINAWHES